MSGEANNRTASFIDLTGQEKLVLYPVVLLIIVIGIYPAPLLEISESAVNTLLHSISAVTASAN
jgi:NADH-quinone oxidoreductase subunit M